jgi:hypothetical protein
VENVVRRILGVLALLLFSTFAHGEALVVQSCGTNPQLYSSGATRYETVDINGNLCSTTTGPGGVTQGVTVAGNASRVALEPTQLFWDDFGTGTLDVTNRWTAPTTGGGGNATSATNAVGATTLGSGNVASGWSILSSQYSFPGKNPGWNFFQEQNNVEFPVLTNAVRFFGFATFPGSPTTAVPYTNAVGFEFGTDGKLRAVTAASGTRNVIADLSVVCASTCANTLVGKIPQPQDAGVHKYIIYFRGDNIYWAIDGVDNVVASTLTGALGPDVNTLPLGHLAVAGVTPPSSTALLTINQATVGDTARNEIKVCDPVNPWRCAIVTSGGTLLPPLPQTSIQGNSTGTSGAVVGTLAAAAGKTTYLCDFDVSALGTAGTPGPVVVAGLLGGSKTYQMSVLATGVEQHILKTFTPCLAASAVNTAITITTTADATGTAVDVNSSGYQQ